MTTGDQPEPGPGFDEGFEDWYRSAYPRLVVSVSLAMGDVELAREAASEACARALQRWRRVKAMAHPTAWAHRVAINVAKRALRRAAAERRLLLRKDEPAIPPPEALPEVWRAVAALPPRQRAAVTLRYVLDLPESQISAAMGIAPGTVAATLHAARARLAALLADSSSEVEVENA